MDEQKRETISFETPISHAKVIIKAWLTGREKRAINAVLFRGEEYGQGELNNIELKVKGEKITEMQDELLKAYLISVNDDITNPFDVILDMIDKDYNFVMSKVNELNSAEEEAVKK